ncbi:MAG: tRNA-intron lyase [Thermoprotei archaeon]
MSKIRVRYSEGHIIAYDPKEAPKLFKEGFYGRPIGIGKPKTFNFEAPLQLSLYEALYLLENGVIEVVDTNNNPVSFEKLFLDAKKNYEDFDLVYSVYKDLRKKGFVVRPGMKFGTTFAVYEYGPGIDHAPFLVEIMKKDSKLKTIDIVGAGRLTHTVRKKLLLAVVNEDNSVNYYMFRWIKF